MADHIINDYSKSDGRRTSDSSNASNEQEGKESVKNLAVHSFKFGSSHEQATGLTYDMMKFFDRNHDWYQNHPKLQALHEKILSSIPQETIDQHFNDKNASEDYPEDSIFIKLLKERLEKIEASGSKAIQTDTPPIPHSRPIPPPTQKPK